MRWSEKVKPGNILLPKKDYFALDIYHSCCEPLLAEQSPHYVGDCFVATNAARSDISFLPG